MRLLLDSHTFLWWVLNDTQLSHPARTAIAETSNQIFFSTVSSWELIIKASLGKLNLRTEPRVFFQQQLDRNQF
jgi:PIN domain nuclease of toxin-antitoxin system